MHEIDLRRIDLNLLVAFDVLMSERSVTAAARRLGRTQSAISHALARLRAQLDDPLLVKSRGGLTASPFAERLSEDVRPILASIRRVLAPPQPFAPATSTQAFRIALPDVSNFLFPALVERIRAEAPRVALEWALRDERVASAVLDGRVDLALIPVAMALPDGLEFESVRPFRWATFVRKDHPALRNWGKSAWAAWPHAAVRVGAAMPSPVQVAAFAVSKRRRVTTWVPQFSAVAPLLARTDLLATLPLIVMLDSIDRFGLRALAPPMRIEPMPHRLIWSRHLGKDPALRWLREHVLTVVDALQREADALLPI